MNIELKKYLSQTKTAGFKDLLFYFLERNGEKNSAVYNRVDIDRRVFSKALGYKPYNLGKDNILKLCISLKLDLNDSSKLLSSAGYSLSTTSDFDLIIRYCISNKIYDFNTINSLLYDYTQTTLSNNLR